MEDSLQGTVSGKIIQLSSNPGFQEGQRVEVVLRPIAGNSQEKRSAAGMLADEHNLEVTLLEIEQDRKSAKYRVEAL